MDALQEKITEEYGERCPDFAAGCINCELWKAYDELVAAGPLTAEEVGKAIHWLDRYSCGFDEYPQFDRVISSRSAPAVEGVEPVAWQIKAYVEESGRKKRTNIYTERLPFTPGEGVTQLSEPQPLYPASAISRLVKERDEARAVHRWNVDRNGDGTLSVCRESHEKGEPCEWERFVPADRAEDLEASVARLTSLLTTATDEFAALRDASTKEISRLTALLVEADEVLAADDLASTVAAIRQGHSSSPRCEPPGQAEIDIAKKWTRYVLEAISARRYQQKREAK